MLWSTARGGWSFNRFAGSRRKGWKLNSDRCSWGNLGLSGGDGLVRDCHGNFVFGYLAFFGTMSRLHAELRALLLGVKYYVERGIQELHVESDSLTLIRIV